jgi:hypothetical protein
MGEQRVKRCALTAVCLVFFCISLAGCSRDSLEKQGGWYYEDTFTYSITREELLNKSSAKVSLTAGNDGEDTVTSVWIEVSFYDVSGALIATQEEEAFAWLDTGEESTVTAFFFYINGIAMTAKLQRVTCEYSDHGLDDNYFSYSWLYSIPIILFAVWILLIICFNRKERYYEVAGYHIVVLAGWTMHRITINGEVVAEKPAFSFHCNLHAERENLRIDVCIGVGFLGNTISTKVNGFVVRDKSEL